MIKVEGRKSAITDLLRSAHTLRIRVRLLDLDHRYLKDLTPAFVEGQVTVDASAEVTRALDLTLFDPLGRIHIEPDSPHRTSVFIADMISVVYVIMSPDRSKVYEIPVFCGPIDKVDRNGMWIDVKCLGKESLSILNLWRGRTFAKGQRKTEVIKTGLLTLVGETKMNIPNKKAKLPNNMSLNRSNRPWIAFKQLANSMGYQLFYDGRGIAQMRKKATTPSMTFSERNMTSEASVSYDLASTINAVDVVGFKPKKAKKRVKYRAVAPVTHPLSPWRLGRGGVPRFLWTEVRDDSLRTVKECKELGDRLLKQGLLAGVEATFDGLVDPRMQELDVIRINTDQLTATMPLKKFTIPLVAGDDASYGYLKKTRPRGGARGVKPKKKNRGGKDWQDPVRNRSV